MSFVAGYKKRNPYETSRSVAARQAGWMQVDSSIFTKRRVEENFRGTPSHRIYLNPRFDRISSVYSEIFNQAERQGLCFRSKVFDPMLRDVKDVQLQASRWEKQKRDRTDPVVFYAFVEDKDALLEIVNDVYSRHQDAFVDRDIAAFPCKVAPGYGVGAEPRGKTGQESLSSHRSTFVHRLASFCGQDPRWEELSPGGKEKFFAATFRMNASLENIDPDNIAFDKLG